MNSCSSLLLVLVTVVLSAENTRVLFAGISPSCHLFLSAFETPPWNASGTSAECSAKRLVVFGIGDSEDAHVGIVDVVNNRIRLQNLHFPSSALLELKEPRKVWTNATARHHFSQELDYGYAAEGFVFSNGKDLFVIGRNAWNHSASALFRFEVLEDDESFSLRVNLRARIDLLHFDPPAQPPILDYESSRLFRLHHPHSAAILFNESTVFVVAQNISTPSSGCSTRFEGKCVGTSPVIPLDASTAHRLVKRTVLYRSQRRHLRMTSPHVRIPRYKCRNLGQGWLFVMATLTGSLFTAFAIYFVVYRISRGRVIS